MLYQIADGSISVGGMPVLSHFNFEIRGNEKIAVIGQNGTGKTTLLRLIAGELDLDADDKRNGPGIVTARRVTIGMLRQQAFDDLERTVEEELLRACPAGDSFERERFEYEREYDTILTGLGFTKADKIRRLRSFSGGEQTKLALIRLLLEKPDILLLDEPTNHLDVTSCEWLEAYLKSYEHAAVIVSHDRFFLDQTVSSVCEITNKKIECYPGNYTDYRKEKLRRITSQQKAWERQQEERNRLEAVIERFKHKPTKAAFTRAKKKQLERMETISRPTPDDAFLFTDPIVPAIPGSKWVFSAEHLRLGYPGHFLLELTFRIRRGQKIGLIGPNGAGKSTFLKTVAGLLPPLAGEYTLGNHITVGYFDQHTARIESDKTVLEHFHNLFPALTEKEARSILGHWLFGGKAASRRVSDLSGGEKSRLILAELLQSRPNFLILDEPTNHMDIQAKETLESAFRAYTGTILFVSHDRYFIRQVAESVLIFENHTAMYDPFGYEHYLESNRRLQEELPVAARIRAEDQALIAGLRAVPRAERHRLREIPEDEARLDWQLRQMNEKLRPLAARYADLEEQYRQLQDAVRQSEDWWATDQMDELPEIRRLHALRGEMDSAWEDWHQGCLEYVGILEDLSDYQ